MDTVNLQEELRGRVRCVQGVPSFLRGQFRSALAASLGGHEGGLQHR